MTMFFVLFYSEVGVGYKVGAFRITGCLAVEDCGIKVGMATFFRGGVWLRR